jgi:RNA polymerase sigma-B factor
MLMSPQLAARPTADRRAERVGGSRQRETLRFRHYRRYRDPSLREELVRSYLPLARSVARRFEGRRVPLEDLVQIAALGLIKALDRYDPARGTAFSSLAVPTMVGEVQRYFRDHTWAVRPPRELQEHALRVARAAAAMSGELGRAPSAGELARRLELGVEQVLDALQAAQARDGTSLEAPRPGGDNTETLGDTLGSEETEYDRVEQAATAERLMAELDPREREVIRLRFHGQRTQSEIGELVGCSQMHVSRILKRALAKLSAATDECR